MKKHLLQENGSFYKANLHCHTTCSDGRLSPEEVKELYKKLGYSIVAYTDHEIIRTHNELSDDKFLAITSSEYSITDSKLAFEFLFGMQLGGKHQPDMFAHEVEPDWEINIFTPTILATYTFSDWMIRPYIGLGFGINFFAVKDKTWEYKDAMHWYKVDDSMKIAPSFNTLFTAGGKYAIPNTNFELNAGLNLSFTVMSCEHKYTHVDPEDGSKLYDYSDYSDNFDTFHVDFDIVLGAVYHF